MYKKENTNLMSSIRNNYKYVKCLRFYRVACCLIEKSKILFDIKMINFFFIKFFVKILYIHIKKYNYNACNFITSLELAQ